MIELLDKISKQEILLEVVDGKLKLFTSNKEVDPALLDEIKIKKEEILQFLLKNGGLKSGHDYLIKKVEPSESYPISDAQRRLWVLSQFDGGSAAYNMVGSAYLNQEIDIDCFKQAIDATIERHEILRTVFKANESGEIRQWIVKREDIGFEIDYQDFSKAQNPEEKVQLYISEDVNKPFNLASGPLLRAGVLQVEDKGYIFYYNMHHIISDGWSMEVLTKDVLAFYEAYKGNKEPALKELRIQYKDYSAWQLAQLNEETFKVHRAYWLESLKGELPLLNLPGTKQRPRIKGYNGRTLSTYLNKEISQALKNYSQQSGGTLFMGLLASLNAFLYHYTGQSDQVIGSPIAGREHADLEPQIGFYVNTLALRTMLNAEAGFETLFSSVKETTLSAYSHQMYPFDRLVEELNLQRDTSRNAVFDVMLVLQNNGEAITGVELNKEQEDAITDHGPGTSKFDLLINVQERGDYLSFSVEYNTDVYEKEMIERFIMHYKSVLSKLLADPKQALATVNYLSNEEKEELLGFNNTTVSYSDKTVMALFEAQAAKTPAAMALQFGGASMTYKELNARSNSLAHVLKEKYLVSSTTKVGVMLERSVESVIAMIGIMKTGACYVPLDHEYPAERVAYIAEDSGLKIILSTEALWEKHALKKSSLVDITKLDLEKGKKSNPENTNHLDDGAYVIYTSGSTGQPKGVLQTHRMMSNLIQWDIYHSGIATGLKHLQYASFSFDASLHDLYFVLSSGGSAYIVKESSRLDYQALKKEIVSNSIQVVSMPFSALNAFCLETKIEDLQNHSIQYIISTAEQLYVNQGLKAFLENNPKVELHNHYGPSETHVVTSYMMSAALGNIESRSSIGKPVSNSWIYILDQHQNLVPQGVEGELYIGGANLATGYLNKEALTKERFVKDPFKQNSLLYKTGDQGYWRADGNIEFIGRKDDQVKIRGYRIELGEIEQALQKHKDIEEAVVLAKNNHNNEKELVAYITSKKEQNTGELRSYLKELLPAYMLPTHYVQLEAMPLTGNGKIDKKALPDPQGSGLGSGAEYLAPRNEIEEKVVEIWEMVLGRKKISVKDDFFDLGGNSMRAMGLSVEYSHSFNVRISIQEIYEKTQLSSHAELIEIRNWIKAEPSEEINEKENIETFDF